VLMEGDYNILGRWVLCWSLCDCLVYLCVCHADDGYIGGKATA